MEIIGYGHSYVSIDEKVAQGWNADGSGCPKCSARTDKGEDFDA